MTTQHDVTVRLDDRVRLMSAVLAATDWPVKSQTRKPHGTHLHARSTRKFLEVVKNHPAVQSMQALLDQNAPLEALFTLALQLNWPQLELADLPTWVPPRWNEQLADFYHQGRLATWWKNEDSSWQASLHESQKMFKNVSFKSMLKTFFGDVAENLIFIPNISYPTDVDLAVRAENELVCIAPPRLAWGDSPPWPYDEDPGYIYRTALQQYGKLLLSTYLRKHANVLESVVTNPLPVSDQFKVRYPTWQEQFTVLFVAAISALYMEKHLSKAEINAYVLMERKMHGMTSLPGMISVLRRYLAAYEEGKYKELVDFLPAFPKQFKVAAKIVSL